MKKILTVYTGGTIGTSVQQDRRALDVENAKRVVEQGFFASGLACADRGKVCFVDAKLSLTTLSENMTLEKIDTVVAHIRKFDLSCYAGVIVLHGTDTLAFTAALFSFLFADLPIPMMLVSGDRPPDDEKSNAIENFSTAVSLILAGIAPNVYVPYRNADGRMWVHLGATLLQSRNFTSDFENAAKDRVFAPLKNGDAAPFLAFCTALSQKRNPLPERKTGTALSQAVLLITPYTGLDYGKISLQGIRAVLHGTYHSGTLCVERSNEKEGYSSYSVLHLAARCKQEGILLCAAPCALHSGQYSSVYDAVQNGGILPLPMTTEAAYAKLCIGLSLGLSGDALADFLYRPLANEIVLPKE